MQQNQSGTHGGARKGAGRPHRNTRQISLRLTPDTIKVLRQGAVKSGLTLSEYAQVLLIEQISAAKIIIETK